MSVTGIDADSYVRSMPQLVAPFLVEFNTTSCHRMRRMSGSRGMIRLFNRFYHMNINSSPM